MTKLLGACGRAIATAGLMVAGLSWVTGTGAAAAVHAPAGVVPAAGAKYVPPGTSIVFRLLGPSSLQGLTVVGSTTGRHMGKVQAIQGGGSKFTPDHPFAGGERVTVDVPSVGWDYSFTTAVTPSPSATAAALRVAHSYDQTTSSSAPVHAASVPDVPTSCPEAVYHTAPSFQSFCMNLGVTTSGTEAGTYLISAPGQQAGIWTDTGQLVWSLPGTNGVFADSVVQYQGHSYMAVFSGGDVSLYDNHYQVAGVITAGGGFGPNQIDLHEFQITPSGDALVGIYAPVVLAAPGSGTETVLEYVVEELSLVQDATGIHTGSLLFEWGSLEDVPTTQSHIPNPGAGGTYDYFHGNAISQDSDGGLLVSSRHTWGIYKIDTNPSDAGFGHVLWEVGAPGDSQLSPTPWCFQHDIVALGSNQYSLYDDGGAGPGCLQGISDHPARALVITVNPATSPAGVTLDQSYSHNPAIFTQFTGSAQVLSDGNVLAGWANFPQATEFSPAGNVLMDLSMTRFSYRTLRFAWDGQPLQPPAVAVSTAPGSTTVWASWNGSTETTAWRVVAGPDANHLAALGEQFPKTGFETAMVLPGGYPVLEVQALNSTGTVLDTSNLINSFGDVVASSGGGIATDGVPAFPGSPSHLRLAAPIVGVAATADGKGCWLVASDGGVFSIGSAHFYGSAASLHLARPIVGIAATPDGKGYWLVASDGGVFSFGTARFYGSAATLHLARPIVGIASAGGRGYWLVASDGGIFSFGTAHFYGSAAGLHLADPIVGIAAVPDTSGYWLAGRDGGVFTYGRARYVGSAAPNKLGSPVVGIAAVPFVGGGYWLVAANGSTEGFLNSSPVVVRLGTGLAGPVAGIAGVAVNGLLG